MCDDGRTLGCVGDGQYVAVTILLHAVKNIEFQLSNHQFVEKLKLCLHQSGRWDGLRTTQLALF